MNRIKRIKDKMVDVVAYVIVLAIIALIPKE